AKPKQPGQQSGRTALPGKQAGVREEGDGHRGAKLGGRLSSASSAIITAVLHPFILTSSRKKNKKEQLYQKNSSATLRRNPTRVDIDMLADSNQFLVLFNLTFLLHDVK
uniref:Uncharacterized protein n=1 Tax=Gasterosteus aculeatus TaxID=69293 RepID=G3QCK2_GASAC